MLSSKPESSERLSLSDSDPDMLEYYGEGEGFDCNNLLCFLLLVLLLNLK